MAPGFYIDHSHPLSVTQVNWTHTNSCYNDYRYVPKKVENKKEKQARLAKEKMHASWKTYNEIKPKIFEVKQICKPRHKLNHIPR